MTGIQGYLKSVYGRIAKVPLSRVLATEGDALLENLYAPLPTTLALTAEVADGRLTRWALGTRRGVISANGETPPALWPLDVVSSTAIFDIARDRLESAVFPEEPHAAPPTVVAPPSQNGIRWNLIAINAADVAAGIDHTVILGPPGSGKTIAARQLALSVLGPQITPPLTSSTLADTSAWPHPPEIPVYVELRELVEWKGFPGADEDAGEDDFWRFLLENQFGRETAETAREIGDALTSGNAILIIDGLDEVPAQAAPEEERSRREQIVRFVGRLVSAYRGCRIVVTSREAGYEGWELDGFTPVTLAPLDDLRLEALGERLWAVSRPGQPGGDEWARTWLKELHKLPSDLYDRPLFATLMAALMFKGSGEELPASRGDLYRESIVLLLERWAQGKRGGQTITRELACSVDDLYARLAHLAYDVYESAPQSGRSALRIELGVLLKHLFLINEHVNPRKVLTYLEEDAGVIVSPKREEYEFAHRGFQEYLAAARLAMPRDASSIVKDLREKLTARPEIWREPAMLVADVLLQEERDADLWEAISLAIEDGHESGLELATASWSAWMAGRWLVKALGQVHAPRSRSSVLEDARVRLGGALRNESPLPGLARAEIGATLALIGDERAGVGTKGNLPAIEWCPIPAGEWVLGLTEDEVEQLRRDVPWAADWSFERETPSYRFESGGFAISQCPVTVAQFQTFIEDPKGYENRQWWTGAGWEWRTQRGAGAPADPEWGAIPTFPRTNVSWYEAVAFCAWLSAKLGFAIRLPLEPEWELAARGPDRRFFPWGWAFEAGKCNNALAAIGGPCVVGCFGSGTQWGDGSPSDMSGNIWEWCSTILEIENGTVYQYPYDPLDGREDTARGEGALRVLRGGAYLNNALNVMGTFRGRDQPSRQYGRHGFRLARP